MPTRYLALAGKLVIAICACATGPGYDSLTVPAAQHALCAHHAVHAMHAELELCAAANVTNCFAHMF